MDEQMAEGLLRRSDLRVIFISILGWRVQISLKLFVAPRRWSTEWFIYLITAGQAGAPLWSMTVVSQQSLGC